MRLAENGIVKTCHLHMTNCMNHPSGVQYHQIEMPNPEPMLTSDIRLDLLLDIIQHERIGVEYQPIIHSGTGECLGYEALARFYLTDGSSLPPQRVFDALHQSPLTLIQVELISKKLQLEAAPSNGMLFVNVDPDAFILPMGEDKHPMLELFNTNRQLVVEIIENSSVQQADLSLGLADALAKQGIRTALDDIGAPASMLSLPILSRVDILKFDRAWLKQLHIPAQRELLLMLLGYAKAQDKMTILEGVETTDDLDLARELGVDAVQGFLYKPRFINVRA